MKDKLLQGALTAIITPFNEQQQVDVQGLRKNIQQQLQAGINGIVALGTTGEAPTLTAEEKSLIVEQTIHEVGGKIPVLVGTGSYSTQETLDRTLQAKAMGADAALVITPYYNKPSQEGLYRHYMTVADKADLPLLIYTNPGRTGANLCTATLTRLAAHPNVVGIKDCSGSLFQMMDIHAEICTQHPHFSLLTGDDIFIMPFLACGGHGVISAISNVVPKHIVGMVAAFQQGRQDKARDIHYQLLPLFKAFAMASNPIPLKAAMDALGMAAGICRLPLCELDPQDKVLLRQALEQVVPPPF